MGKVATASITTAVILDEAKKEQSGVSSSILGGFWTASIERIYLSPFSLDTHGPMARSREHAAEIISRNSEAGLHVYDFTVPSPERGDMDVIFGATLVGPAGYEGTSESVLPFQMTPGYTVSISIHLKYAHFQREFAFTHLTSSRLYREFPSMRAM